MSYDYQRLDADWTRMFRELEPSPTASAVGTLLQQASDSAARYREEGLTIVVLTPGTGWEYKTVLADLTFLPAQMITFQRDGDSLNPDHVDLAREAAQKSIPFGGELLFAMPEWQKTSLVLNHGLHTPDYLGEKTGMDYVHTIPLAIFLTAFSEAVMEARA